MIRSNYFFYFFHFLGSSYLNNPTDTSAVALHPECVVVIFDLKYEKHFFKDN